MYSYLSLSLSPSLPPSLSLFQMIVYGMLIITFGCMPPCAIVVCVYPFVTRRRTLANVNSSNHRPYGYTPLTQVGVQLKQQFRLSTIHSLSLSLFSHRGLLAHLPLPPQTPVKGERDCDYKSCPQLQHSTVDHYLILTHIGIL